MKVPAGISPGLIGGTGDVTIPYQAHGSMHISTKASGQLGFWYEAEDHSIDRHTTRPECAVAY
jgi:hypothetical protein